MRGRTGMMRRKVGWLVLMALALLIFTASAAETTLKMPANLKIIEAEAFYGDQAISRVVLGDQVTEIRSKAFAKSSLTSINLPASLNIIADDALPRPEQVTVTVEQGTYAYTWAKEHGYLGGQVTSPTQNTPTVEKSRQITVHWSAVNSAESYRVLYSTTEDPLDGTEIAGLQGTSYTILNLEPGTVYSLWVRAVTDGIVSYCSDRKEALTYPALPSMKTPVVSGNSITLSWDKVKGATIQRLYYSTEDDFATAVKIDEIPATQTSYTISGLDYGRDYYIWSGSANGSGGVRSTNSTKVTTEMNSSGPEQKAAKGGIRKITVSWNAFSGAKSYKVFFGKTDKISGAEELTGITGTSYEIGNLDAGATYYTWVKAVTASGDSGVSNIQSARTLPAAPVLATPTVSGNTISLNWEAADGAEWYYVRYGTTDKYENSGRTGAITGTSYTLQGLEFSRKYYIWMEAYHEGGGVRTPNAVEVTTGEDAGTPKQNAPEGGQFMVTVNWEAVTGADSYNVYYGTSAGFSAASKKTGVTGTSCEVKGLQAGTTYYTWVTAVSGGKESAPSNRKGVITMPKAATLKTPVVSGNSITLSWDEVTGATKYYLRYGTSSDVNKSKTTVYITDETYTIADLEYNTTYYIWIVSVNDSGSVRSANPVTAKTAAQ